MEKVLVTTPRLNVNTEERKGVLFVQQVDVMEIGR